MVYSPQGLIISIVLMKYSFTHNILTTQNIKDSFLFRTGNCVKDGVAPQIFSTALAPPAVGRFSRQ